MEPKLCFRCQDYSLSHLSRSGKSTRWILHRTDCARFVVSKEPSEVWVAVIMFPASASAGAIGARVATRRHLPVSRFDPLRIDSQRDLRYRQRR